MPQISSAIIIGSGIAGLALARALQRQGIGVRVFEQAASARDAGVGLTLWSNGVAAIRQIDDSLLHQIFKSGRVLESFRFLNSGGALLGAINVEHLNRLTGEPSVLILRRDLINILAQGVEVHFNKRFAHYKTFATGHGVAAYFDDGTCYEADILIGADGFNSTVLRSLGFASERDYAGYTCYRGYARVPRGTLPQGALWQITGVGSQFGLMQIADDLTAWYATANMPSHVIEDGAERKIYLLERFGQWAKPVADVLAASTSRDILKNDIYHRDTIYRWHTGPVAIIGDAAHPTTPNLGQGACLALEDASVLSRCLAIGGTAEQCFERFYKRRARRTGHVVRMARRTGNLCQSENTLILKNRDRLLKMMLKGGRVPALDKVLLPT